MMKTEKLDAMKAALKDGLIVQALGGVTKSREQSDKLGFDWVNTVINKVVVAREYEEQENPVGTGADNPIEYDEGVPLIDNAYYRKDGEIFVWMEEWVKWDAEA